MNKSIRDAKDEEKDKPLDKRIAMGYDPIFRSKYTNANNSLMKAPILKKKADDHEIQHHNDNIYVKNKYGANVAKKIHYQSIDNNKKGKSDEIASEYNAYTIGSNVKNIKDNTVHDRFKLQTQKIMDDTVKGKKTPKVTEDMKKEQQSVIPKF